MRCLRQVALTGKTKSIFKNLVWKSEWDIVLFRRCCWVWISGPGATDRTENRARLLWIGNWTFDLHRRPWMYSQSRRLLGYVGGLLFMVAGRFVRLQEEGFQSIYKAICCGLYDRLVSDFRHRQDFLLHHYFHTLWNPSNFVRYVFCGADWLSCS